MSISNSKFRNNREAPTEPFKRSVASCLKAIAKTPELDVTFAAERPGLAPGKARLPEPARKMSKRDAAIIRGHADSIALKLACHDPKVHRKLMPGNPQARGVFELELVGGFAHLGGEAILQLHRAAFEEIDTVLHQCRVFLGVDEIDTGARAALDLVEHARPRAAGERGV